MEEYVHANDANWCLHCGANGFCWSFYLYLCTTNMRNKWLQAKYDLFAGIRGQIRLLKLCRQYPILTLNTPGWNHLIHFKIFQNSSKSNSKLFSICKRFGLSHYWLNIVVQSQMRRFKLLAPIGSKTMDGKFPIKNWAEVTLIQTKWKFLLSAYNPFEIQSEIPDCWDSVPKIQLLQSLRK